MVGETARTSSSDSNDSNRNTVLESVAHEKQLGSWRRVAANRTPGPEGVSSGYVCVVYFTWHLRG